MEGRNESKPGPLVLDAQASENWRKFLMQFEIYLIVKEKDKKPDKLKVHVNLLLNCAGPEAIDEYSHFVYNEGESKAALPRYVRSSRNYVKGPRTWYMSDWYSINDTTKKESGLTASLVSSNNCLWCANLESSEIRWLGIVLLEEYGLMIWEVSCSRSQILLWPVLMTTAERLKQLNCRSTNLLQQWAQAQKVNQEFRRYRKIADSRRKLHVLVSSVDTAIHLLTQTGALPLARNAWSARNRDTLQRYARVVHKWTL